MNDYHLKMLKMATLAVGRPPGLLEVDVWHDDSCPAIKTGSMRDCTCEPEMKLRTRGRS